MKANEVIFQKLLDGKIQYVVPLWQRTYSWEEKQWERLWEDILDIYAMESPRNHFIGSVVTQEIITPPERASRYLLIDGQQRMTTLFILLSAIKSLASERTDEYRNLPNEIEETCLKNKFAADDDRVKLVPTQLDREPFESVLDDAGTIVGSQIGKAQEFFRKAVEEGDDEKNQIDLQHLHRCIVNHLDMVSVHLDHDDSPNRIFESLNNTGLPLTVADSIRNYILMNFQNSEEQEKAYFEYWQPLENRLIYNEKDVSGDFFWHYLMMNGSLPRKDDTYNEIQKRLELDAPDKALAAVKEFARFSVHYARISGIINAGLNDGLQQQIDRINRWEVSVCYPFLLSAMDQMESGALADHALVQALQMIESFVIRRAVCAIPTNQLRRIFAQMAVNSKDASDFVGTVHETLHRNQWPDDDQFREGFVTFPIYQSGRINRTNFLLWRLENAFEHKEMPASTEHITIDHIMPQALTSEWKSELGEEIQNTHNRWLHTIGNLTLTGYNAELSNRSFADKKAWYAQSNFAVSSSLQSFGNWNADAIQNRGRELADLAVEIWGR